MADKLTEDIAWWRLNIYLTNGLAEMLHVVTRKVEPDSVVSAFEASSATLLKVRESVPSPEC